MKSSSTDPVQTLASSSHQTSSGTCVHINSSLKRTSSTLGFHRGNLTNCPPYCRCTACLALVRSTCEYGSIICNPHNQTETDKRSTQTCPFVHFIFGDYHSRNPDCVTKMLIKWDLPTLQDRRDQQRLFFFYKMVEWLVPAILVNQFLKPLQTGKRQIKPTISGTF